MPSKKTATVSKTTGLPIDRKRSLAAKRGAATRRANLEARAAKRALRLHHKVFAAAMIAAVVVLAGLGIANTLGAYAASTMTGTTFVGLGNKCLDDKHSQVENRNWIWLYQCNNTNAQKWTVSGSAIKTSLGSQNYCIDDPGQSKMNGIAVWLYQCNGSKAQQWTISNKGQLINAVAGYCLTVKNGNTSNGTRLVLQPCNDSQSQLWTARSATASIPVPTSPVIGNGGSSSGNSGGGSTGGGTGKYGIYGKPLDVNTNSLPYGYQNSINGASASDQALYSKITSNPVAFWVTDNYTPAAKVQSVVSAANSHGAIPQLVMYYIPRRDCGNYSAGGAPDAGSYQAWVDQFVSGLGNTKAIVIVEPDGLPLMSCLSSDEMATRFSLEKYAIQKVAAQGSWVYIDAGTDVYQPVDVMTSRLQQAGIQYATGFAMNISMFRPNSNLIAYGDQLSKNTGGKHFIIDTSRNGLATSPTDYSWCNPTPRGLGNKPTENTGVPLLDAYLWIKVPGGSDGSCDGAPGAGEWYPSYALMLARNAVF